MPGRFTEYYKSARFDKIARACLQHFLAVVEQHALSKVQHSHAPGATVLPSERLVSILLGKLHVLGRGATNL